MGMTAIASRGKGDYEFLRTAQEIPKKVSKSVHSFLSLTGTEAKLNVRGLNGACVTKVYGLDDGNEEGEEGGGASATSYAIGDLHSDNTKQILVEVEVKPTTDTTADILEFELSYNPPAAADNEKKQCRAALTGVMQMAFTSKRSDVENSEVNEEVTVAVAIQDSVIAENRVVELMELGKREEAHALKEKSVASLQGELSRLQASPNAAARASSGSD